MCVLVLLHLKVFFHFVLKRKENVIGKIIEKHLFVFDYSKRNRHATYLAIK
jgi:hypothetical protein